MQDLVDSFALRQELKVGLAKIQDLERLAGRVVSGSASPKDLVAIKETLRAVGELRAQLDAVAAPILTALRSDLADLPAVIDLIERAIVDDPPFSIKDGGFIRAGFDAELDEIRAMRTHAKEWMRQFEAERATTHRHPFAEGAL